MKELGSKVLEILSIWGGKSLHITQFTFRQAVLAWKQ